MSHRQFKPDLAGTGETLEHLLDRLRSYNFRRTSTRERSFSSRRPPRNGAGGAEAPIPRTKPAPDLYAPG